LDHSGSCKCPFWWHLGYWQWVLNVTVITY
jgi:hypothetical protein